MKSPKQLLEQAVKQYNTTKFIMLYSGGNDSHTTLHATQKAIREMDLKIELRLMYWNTGINIPENREFVLHTANKQGLELIELKPEPHFNFESLIQRFGFLGVGGHRFALGFLKWFGFRKFARENKLANYAYISGRRLLESTARTKMISNKDLDKPESNMNFVSPLFYLDNTQRDCYMNKYSLYASPCYTTVHTDGNCQCGCYAQKDELTMMYVFHKEVFDYIKKMEDRYGGIRQTKVIESLKTCPNCNKSGYMIGGKTRFINGIHCYLYDCLSCFTRLQIPDDKMPYHYEDLDRGYWGNGISTKEVLAEPPPPNDLICHGCKQAYLLKKQLIYGDKA